MKMKITHVPVVGLMRVNVDVLAGFQSEKNVEMAPTSVVGE